MGGLGTAGGSWGGSMEKAKRKEMQMYDIPVVAKFKAPLYVAWEITHRCNANCMHCYSNSSSHANCDFDLSTKEGIEVIDQLADAGVLVLAFSGGEPLLRLDWHELVDHAINKGLNVNIGTNGSSVTKKIADEIKRIGIKSVTVSIDSHKADVHDNFRQLDGLHEKALNAIKLFVERRVRVVVGFTPTRLNWEDGKEVIELAHTIEADAVNLSEYVPAGRGGLALALRPEELHKVLIDWINFREEYKGKMEIMWHDCRVGLLVPEGEKRNYVGCGAGRLVARICPDGTVTPCVFLSTSIGSFRKETFQDMWLKSTLLRQFREREKRFDGNCKDCEHLQSCGGCRAVAYAYSGGNPLAGDPHCWIKLAQPNNVENLLEGESLPI